MLKIVYHKSYQIKLLYVCLVHDLLAKYNAKSAKMYSLINILLIFIYFIFIKIYTIILEH